MAVANYHDANGRYPPPFVIGPDGKPWHSWRVLILPYIEESQLYDAYNFSEPWDGPTNRALASRMPRVYSLNGQHHPGQTIANYLAVVGDETVWPRSQAVKAADVTDGSTQTILLVENLGANVHWMEPRDLSLAEMDMNINSPKGISSGYKDPAAAMLSVEVRRFRSGIKPETLRALFTIRGGEQVSSDDAGNWELLPDGRQRDLRAP